MLFLIMFVVSQEGKDYHLSVTKVLLGEGGTVWMGSAFDCPNTKLMIVSLSIES